MSSRGIERAGTQTSLGVLPTGQQSFDFTGRTQSDFMQPDDFQPELQEDEEFVMDIDTKDGVEEIEYGEFVPISGQLFRDVKKVMKRYHTKYNDGSDFIDVEGAIRSLQALGFSNPEQIYDIFQRHKGYKDFTDDKGNAIQFIETFTSPERVENVFVERQDALDNVQAVKDNTASVETWSQTNSKQGGGYFLQRRGLQDQEGIIFMLQTFFPNMTANQIRLALGQRPINAPKGQGAPLDKVPEWLSNSLDAVLGSELSFIMNPEEFSMYVKNSLEDLIITGEAPTIEDAPGNVFDINVNGLSNYFLSLGESIAGNKERAEAYIMREFIRQFRDVAGLDLNKFVKEFSDVPLPIARTAMMAIYGGKVSMREAKDIIFDKIRELPGGQETLLALEMAGFEPDEYIDSFTEETTQQALDQKPPPNNNFLLA